MAKTITISPEEKIARGYADRLLLAQISELQSVVKLSEIADRLSDQGIGLAVVRSLLASNPERFSYTDRRWVPAARLESVGRPLAEKIRTIVDRFGGPMPFDLLMNELRLISPEIEDETVLRLIDGAMLLARTKNNAVFLRDWCFSATDENLHTALEVHGLQESELHELQAKLSKVDWREAGAAAKAVASCAPVNSTLFGAVAWAALNPQDPRAYQFYHWKSFYAEIFGVEDLVYGADGFIHPASDTKKWLTAAVRLADKLAPTVEIEDAQPIEVQPSDVDKMVERIRKSATSVSATRLLEEFYEVTPSVKTFPDDIRNVIDALKARNEVLWVGGDSFNQPGIVPEFVQAVPDLFQFSETPFLDEEGEHVDIELTDDGLTSTLRKLLNHPLAVDVLDEDEVPVPKQTPESTRCVLKSIHREVGTFPLAQLPPDWFQAEPKYQEVMFIDQSGRELQVWINAEARLMFGLIDWFYEQPVESGAVFQLTRTSRPNIFDFEWLDQSDPVVYITNQRMEELREIQSRSDDMSTYDILREVMGHWPKGADFLTLLWEVNVVRRTSRRMVASLLSSYACFYQRSGSPVWHYDSKKVEQGFDKSKRKFIRK